MIVPARREARGRPQQVQLAEAFDRPAAHVDAVVLQYPNDAVAATGVVREPDRNDNRHQAPRAVRRDCSAQSLSCKRYYPDRLSS